MAKKYKPPKRSKVGIAEKRAAYGFLAPTAILFILIFIFPVFFVIATSFTAWNMLVPAAGIRFIGIRNYVSILQDPGFWIAFRNTFVFVIFSVPISMALGLGLALSVDKLGRSRKYIEILLLIPMMVAPVSIFLAFRFLFEPTFGTVNKLLALIGIQGPLWLASIETALLTVIIVEVWRVTPFIYIVSYAALKMVSHDPIEAAKVDGANSFQTFRHVTFNMIKPALVVVLIVRIMDAIRTFDNIFVLTRGGPGHSTRTLQFITFEQSFESLNVGRGSAMAVIMVVIIFISGAGLIRIMNKINEESF